MVKLFQNHLKTIPNSCHNHAKIFQNHPKLFPKSFQTKIIPKPFQITSPTHPTIHLLTRPSAHHASGPVQSLTLQGFRGLLRFWWVLGASGGTPTSCVIPL
jgi:hypothetical protein